MVADFSFKYKKKDKSWMLDSLLVNCVKYRKLSSDSFGNFCEPYLILEELKNQT